MANKKLHIIWPVFNAADSVGGCIDNMKDLSESLSAEYEVIITVFDDASSDGTDEVLKEKSVNVVTGTGDAWWSGGVNGILEDILGKSQNPSSELVLLWGNDLRINPEKYAALLDSVHKVEENPKEIIGATITYFDGTIFSKGCTHHKSGKETNRFNKLPLNDYEYTQVYERVDWLGGMGLVASLQAFADVGLFNADKCPQYYGDTEWCMRSGKFGYVIYNSNDLVVANDTTNTGIGNSYYEYLNLKRILTQKRSRFYFPAVRYYTIKYNLPLIGHLRLLQMVLVLVLKYLKAKAALAAKSMIFMFFNSFVSKIPWRSLRVKLYGPLIARGKNIQILRNVCFLNPWKRAIRMGSNIVINPEVILDGRGSDITIGNNVDIGRRAMLYTLQHDTQSPYHSVRSAPLVIEDYVWISTNTTILPGVTLGEGCVVASGAVVSKDCEPYGIYAGVPAKKVGERTRNLKYTLRFEHPFL